MLVLFSIFPIIYNLNPSNRLRIVGKRKGKGSARGDAFAKR